SLVSTIRAVHVPLPWRRLLPRRLAGLGSTGTRLLRISVQSRKRHHHNPGRRTADAGTGRGTYPDPRRKGKAMRLISQIGEWFDRRLQLATPIREAAEHPVPRNTASWWYVFGSAALVVFLLQLV